MLLLLSFSSVSCVLNQLSFSGGGDALSIATATSDAELLLSLSE
jgi:hypothetical protein